MSIKEDLLRKLPVKQLKKLAIDNDISLVRENKWDFAHKKYELTKKEDIIEALLESSKITKEKIMEILEPTPEKKKVRKISKAVKEQVWKKYIGVKKTEGKCYVCKKTIHIMDFEVGHNKAFAKGGTNKLNNLRPICRSCNSSMGTTSIEVYKRKYFSTKRSV